MISVLTKFPKFCYVFLLKDFNPSCFHDICTEVGDISLCSSRGRHENQLGPVTEKKKTNEVNALNIDVS